MRLDGQVPPARLEHGEHGGHPVQVPLQHHGDDPLAGQPPGEQAPTQLVRAGVELPVRPLPVALHRGDRVRAHRHHVLEQLVHPPVRQFTPRARQLVELETEFGVRQQHRPVRLGEDGQVVARDAGGGLRVEDVGAVPQPQRAAGDAHLQRRVLLGGFTRQRAEDLRVGGLQCGGLGRHLVGQGHFVLRHTGHRSERPPRNDLHRSLSPLVPSPCGTSRQGAMCCPARRGATAGFPPHRDRAGISSPFIRKESAASSAPSPIETP